MMLNKKVEPFSGFTSICRPRVGTAAAAAAFHRGANQWRLRFVNGLNRVRPSTPGSNMGKFRVFPYAALYGRLEIAKNSRKAFLLPGFERGFRSGSARGAQKYFDWRHIGKVILRSSSCSSLWVWLKKHKSLSFTISLGITCAFSFGTLQWVPLAERMRIAISADEQDNMIGALTWEHKARENEGRILKPESPESVRAVRILREILQASHQLLGLKNDFKVSVYVPRKELKMPKGKGGEYDDWFEFKKKVIRYYFSHPNKRVQNKPRKVRKFGIIYGTEHLEGLNWEVMVIESNTAYACYFLFGRIMIHSPFLRDSGFLSYLVTGNRGFTDADLATVLAHEVGHALAQHSSGKLCRIAAYLCLGLVRFLPDDFDNYEPVKGINHTFKAISAFFSRRNETEADRIGMILMAAAGYDPHQAPAFYEKYFKTESNVLSTHPSGKERAEKLRDVEVMRKAEEIYNQVRASQQNKASNQDQT